MTDAPGPLLYTSDLEGRWDKLEQALAGCPWARLDGDELRVEPGAVFLFGGDTVDRGPASLRLVSTLVRAQAAMPDRVVLLAGNRDINKLRLPRELGATALPGFPEAGPERLREILRRTMGAPDAFDHRVAELGGASDEAVVESFLEEVQPPTGPLFRYLRQARLGFRWRDVLVLHGGPSPENLGVVPGADRETTLAGWLSALNRFLQRQLDAYEASPTGRDHAALVQYQAPLPGTRANAQSVVYARPVNAQGEPQRLAPAVVDFLRREGIRRLVVGHTPTGDCPSVLVYDDITLLMADTSYSPLEHGARVELHADHSRIVGAALVDGVQEPIDQHLPLSPPWPIGRWIGGELIKAQLSHGWLGFHMAPGFTPVQRRRLLAELGRDEALEPQTRGPST